MIWSLVAQCGDLLLVDAESNLLLAMNEETDSESEAGRFVKGSKTNWLFLGLDGKDENRGAKFVSVPFENQETFWFPLRDN